MYSPIFQIYPHHKNSLYRNSPQIYSRLTSPHCSIFRDEQQSHLSISQLRQPTIHQCNTKQKCHPRWGMHGTYVILLRAVLSNRVRNVITASCCVGGATFTAILAENHGVFCCICFALSSSPKSHYDAMCGVGICCFILVDVVVASIASNVGIDLKSFMA